MLVIPTYVAKSPIHGLGVFAAEDIPKGTIMWVYNQHIDTVIRKDEMGEAPDHVKEYLDKYAWTDNDGHWCIGVDNDKFINHSDTPNTGYVQTSMVFLALRDIAKDEEITEDYATFSYSQLVQCGLQFDK